MLFAGKSVKPGESVEFILKAKCQLYGTYKDKLVIEFDLTTLNIPLLLNLSEGEILSGPTTTSLNTKQNLAPYRLSSREQRTIDMVPGERVTKNPRFLDKRIGENPVPDFLRDIVLRNSSYVTMVEEINVQRSWLFDSLMPKNYFGKLKTLVHLEELACELAFRLVFILKL